MVPILKENLLTSQQNKTSIWQKEKTKSNIFSILTTTDNQ